MEVSLNTLGSLFIYSHVLFVLLNILFKAGQNSLIL